MRSVLITGASSGIGRATAKRLADADFEVFATVREPDNARSLEQETSSIRPVELDVTDAESIARCAGVVADAVGDRGLDGLVNNAGAPFPGPLEVLPIEDFRGQLEVNLTGQLAVTQAFLPMLRRAEGRLLFVSSLGGRVAFPFAGAYHASKFGIEAIGESLRQELRGTGIDVCLIEPGTTESEIWDKAAARTRELIVELDPRGRARYSDQLNEFERRMGQAYESGMEADSVAKVVERALTSSRSPSFRQPVGFQARLLSRVRGLIPDPVFDRLATRTLGGR